MTRSMDKITRAPYMCMHILWGGWKRLGPWRALAAELAQGFRSIYIYICKDIEKEKERYI
jgi:hypothetical protein